MNQAEKHNAENRERILRDLYQRLQGLTDMSPLSHSD
jgi:hypothetical protein